MLIESMTYKTIKAILLGLSLIGCGIAVCNPNATKNDKKLEGKVANVEWKVESIKTETDRCGNTYTKTIMSPPVLKIKTSEGEYTAQIYPSIDSTVPEFMSKVKDGSEVRFYAVRYNAPRFNESKKGNLITRDIEVTK
jgi:hypothetical protein